jgi:hypothetical protein
MCYTQPQQLPKAGGRRPKVAAAAVSDQVAQPDRGSAYAWKLVTDRVQL